MPVTPPTVQRRAGSEREEGASPDRREKGWLRTRREEPAPIPEETGGSPAVKRRAGPGADLWDQKLKRRPNWPAKGTPTVVPGPKKSPKAPAGTRNWFRLVMGWVRVQAALRQNAVAL